MNRKPANSVVSAIDGTDTYTSIIHLDESNFDQAINKFSVPILVDL